MRCVADEELAARVSREGALQPQGREGRARDAAGDGREICMRRAVREHCATCNLLSEIMICNVVIYLLVNLLIGQRGAVSVSGR